MGSKINIGKSLVRDLVHLVFPEDCLICGNELALIDQHLCSFCLQDLTLTNFDRFQEHSPMDQLFWGRLHVEYTYAHLQFKKTAGSQKVLFALKYKKNSQLGVFFGKIIGERISAQLKEHNIDGLIPVPLHPKKQFIRGYNQSEVIARGISESTSIPVMDKLVQRTHFTSSQTGKSRFERWDNVNERFKVDKKIKALKHIAVIDDVITTGSTLESIIQLIIAKHPQVKVSVITLAIA